MFFLDRRIAPAASAVELRDQRRCVFDSDLIDAILEAVQREQAAVGVHASRLDRAEHGVRTQTGIPGNVSSHACFA
jgi:hypothetical protein